MSPYTSSPNAAMLREVRDAIVSHHGSREATPDPTALDDPRLLALLLYLYAPAAIDSETGFPLIPATTLALIEGKERQQRSKNYVARDFLVEYQERVDPSFRWRQHDLGARRPRSVREFQADPILLRLARQPVPSAGDLVCTMGGALRESRAIHLQALRDRVPAEHVVDRSVGRLLEYLNGLPSNRFTRAVGEHHEEATRLAASMLAAGDLEPAEFVAAAATMNAMVAQPVPVYAPSRRARTSRIFPRNPGLPTLRGEIAEVYRQGWGTYDLVSAQTAINAVDWGASVAIDFLERHVGEDGALWTAFYESIGFDHRNADEGERKRVKKQLKRATYSLQYGKAANTVRRELNGGLGVVGERRGNAFMANPLVADLIAARDRHAERVQADGGVVGGFGEWIPLEPGRRVASVMSERSQGVELSLLTPALELAIDADDRWQIVLWQHDGFDVAFRDRTRARGLDAAIRGAVNRECERQGYPTVLTSDLKAIPRERARRRAVDRPMAASPHTTTRR
ncbi:MAG TPA: hypothetical protein EYG39_09705 [Rhodothermales bacterium]|nr:hypothetical protein [Rhodothermales bacterium]